MSSLSPHIAVLAAGAGERMKGAHPKALHPLFFRPLVHFVLDAASATSHRSLSMVVGRGEREFREQCRGYVDLRIVRQEAPGSVVDAVLALESALDGQEGDVLIVSGDTPLLTAPSLTALLSAHAEAGAACTSVGDDVHCFRLRGFFDALRRHPGEGLGDVVAALAAGGLPVATHRFADPDETLGVDDLEGLNRVEAVLQTRHNRQRMLAGVELKDPRTTVIDPRCRIGRDAVIEGGCLLVDSVLEAGVLVESHCRIVDSEVGAGTRLLQGTLVDASRVGRDCRVGPYAHLRRGARLDDGVWVAGFVELDNATLGAGTRVGHHGYIGDAQVGRNVDIGGGFITCNASGRALKRRTVIEDGVFIGSASQAIAPVTVGAGSFVATGTSVTDDVPPDSFVISRGRQVSKPGFAKKYGKPKGPAAPR